MDGHGDFYCTQCYKSFQSKFNLKRHQSSHHDSAKTPIKKQRLANLLVSEINKDKVLFPRTNREDSLEFGEDFNDTSQASGECYHGYSGAFNIDSAADVGSQTDFDVHSQDHLYLSDDEVTDVYDGSQDLFPAAFAQETAYRMYDNEDMGQLPPEDSEDMWQPPPASVESLDFHQGNEDEERLSYYPLQNEAIAELAILCHGTHSIPKESLKYIWHLLKKRDSNLPSLESVQQVVDGLPGFQAPEECQASDGTPFTTISVIHQLRQFMATPSNVEMLMRHPRKNTDNMIREIYDADYWCTNATYHTPMIRHDETDYFVGDFIKVKLARNNIQLGRIVRFYLKVHEDTEGLMVEVRLCKLVDTNKVCFLNDKAAYPTSMIAGHYDGEISSRTVGWRVEGNLAPIRLDKEICESLARGSHIKRAASGRRVVTVPVMLFSDDFGGNLTKKWNKMGAWTMQVAGVPMEHNMSLNSIKFLSTSNNVSVYEQCKPIVEELKKLEEGVLMYDAKLDEEVIVISPLLCLLADNERSGNLVNHLGASASLYCRLCDINRANGHKEGSKRTRKMTEESIQKIKSATTESARKKMRTATGVSEVVNPLFSLKSFKANECTPLERLHTILLGPCKSMTKSVFDKMTSEEKKEIQTLLQDFDWSSFTQKLGNVVSSSNTFFGRDFRLWTQVSPYILIKHMDAATRRLWTKFSEVFLLAYMQEIPTDKEEQERRVKIVKSFLAEVKRVAPELLNTLKVHLMVHLPEHLMLFGPMKAYSTERHEAMLSNVKERYVKSNRKAPSKDIAASFSRLEHLRFIFSGGKFKDEDGTMRSCGEGILRMSRNKHHFQYLFSEKMQSKQKQVMHLKLKQSDEVLVNVLEEEEMCLLKRLAGIDHDSATGTLFRAVGDNDQLHHIGDCVEYIANGEIKYGKIVNLYSIEKKERVLLNIFTPTTRMDCYGSQVYKLEGHCLIKPHAVNQPAHFLHLCEHTECSVVNEMSTTVIERQRVVRQGKTVRHHLEYPYYRRNRFFLGNTNRESYQ